MSLLKSLSFWILIVSIALRLAFAVVWHNKAESEDQLFRMGDSQSYWTLAQQIAKGEPYQYGSEEASVFRAPLLPLVLAPTIAATNGATEPNGADIESQRTAVFYCRLQGALLGGLAVWLAGKIAEAIGGRGPMLWAMAGMAIYPSAIGMSVLILSEMLFLPLMLGHLWLLVKASQSAPKGRWGLVCSGGIVAGLAVLTRPSWLLFVPFLHMIWLIVAFIECPKKRRPKKQGQPQSNRAAALQQLLIACLSLLCMAAVMSPWWYRNYQVTQRFVLTTLQVGPSLYDGLHPEATGRSDSGMNFMADLRQRQLAADAQLLAIGRTPESTFEFRLNELAKHEALGWAQANPTRCVQLALNKLLATWAIWPNGGDLASPIQKALVSIASISVLALAAYGSITIASKQRIIAITLWTPCIYFTLLHMVFVGSVRYREPALIALMALAGWGAAGIYHRLSQRKTSRPK